MVVATSPKNSVISVTIRVWRQPAAGQPGKFVDYPAKDLNPNMSLLEMLDVVNDKLEGNGEDPIAFAHDCREGICGTCSLVIDGKPHGPHSGVASCQTYMRSFKDGSTITLEPFRAKPFPVLRDLIVDRSAFDKIIQSGGYISVNTGAAPDANSIPVPKPVADYAMDAAQCIGCGACVAACKNASAMLFTSAKVSHLNSLPQGQPERNRRVLAMVGAMDEAGFGSCTNFGECEAVCPKSISLDMIAQMNRDYFRASVEQVFNPPSEAAAGA